MGGYIGEALSPSVSDLEFLLLNDIG